MSSTQTTAPPVPPHIIAMQETTAAVKAFHRFIRNLVIVVCLLQCVGAVIAYNAVQSARASVSHVLDQPTCTTVFAGDSCP